MANGGHTSGDAVVGVTVAFTILAVISTCMRLYTRIFMSQMGGVDDFFIAASTVSLHRPLYRKHFSILTRFAVPRSSVDRVDVPRRFVVNTSHAPRTDDLTTNSQIRHGTTSRKPYNTRQHVAEYMVLGLSLALLPFTLFREDGHLVPVSSHLPATNVPQTQLRTHGIHHRLLLLDHFQRHILLLSGQLFLDAGHRPRSRWKMLEPTGRLVRYHDRSTLQVHH